MINHEFPGPPAASFNPAATAAALDEMRFWVQIMGEHAKFIRSGIDPSQETTFRDADAFAVEFDRLQRAVACTPPGDFSAVSALISEVIPRTVALRNFKAQLFKAISQCAAVAELPAALLDHIRREADFFLNNLYRAMGQPAVPREILGIPDGGTPATVLPRLLIPFAGQNILLIARDENLFHLRIQEEHGEVLLLVAYRPKLQDMLYRETAKFENQIETLHQQAMSVPLRSKALLKFNAKVRDVMMCWHDFLMELFQDVINCKVPSGQINTPALILDHMAREVEYYISVIDIVNRSIA